MDTFAIIMTIVVVVLIGGMGAIVFSQGKKK